MNKHTFIYICIIVLLSGCGEKLHNIFHREHAPLEVQEIQFDYFSGKIKIDYEGNKQLSGIANLRIKKDSVIWISLSPGLGVEVARIFITQDSISIIDKINKQYTITDFASISKKFDFDINYSLLESVVLGNLVTPYSDEMIRKTEKFYSYENQFGNFHFLNSIGTKTHKLEKLMVQDTVSENSIYVNYSEFQLVEDQTLPFAIKAELTKGKPMETATKVDIAYNKAEIEKKPLKFPFNVPQKYERNQVD